MSAQRPMLVGLTGGIASGKSAVAKLFLDLGVPVIDTDELAREVVAPGTPGLEIVRRAFGDGVLANDGSLDRARLRHMVFANPARRAHLEEILHPLILRRLQAASADAGGPYQIHVVPLLVESGLERKVDRVLVVDCSEHRQISRLMGRDGETEESARRILAAQSGRQARLSAADDVILNEGQVADLAPLVARLDAFYRGLAESGEFSSPGLRLP
jgi:dephospho-CoA kinase